MIHLLTGWSEEYQKLAALTFEGKAIYAKRHGYQIDFYEHVQKPDPRIVWDRPAQWLKALHRIPDNDWLWHLGCDTVLTNYRIPLESVLLPDCDLIATSDYGPPQGDSLLIRNCPQTRRWLARVLAWEGLANDEQEAMAIELSPHPDYRSFYQSLNKDFSAESVQKQLNGQDVRTRIVSAKTLSAYPLKYYHQGAMGNDAVSWEPGDLLAHLACKTLEERLKIVPEILIASADYLGDK